MTQYKILIHTSHGTVEGMAFASKPKSALRKFAGEEIDNLDEAEVTVTPFRNYHGFRIKDGEIIED